MFNSIHLISIYQISNTNIKRTIDIIVSNKIKTYSFIIQILEIKILNNLKNQKIQVYHRLKNYKMINNKYNKRIK